MAAHEASPPAPPASVASVPSAAGAGVGDPADDAARVRLEIESATRRAQRPPSSGIVANLLVFAALLAVILVVIREMNQGAPKETSPFEAPPPSASATPRPAERPGAPSAAPSGPSFSGEVRLADGQSAPQGILYLIVRMEGAPDRGPPIAVERIPDPSFPVRFTISAANLMQPGTPFEGPFHVRARLDTDGNAMTKSPGDLVSSTPASAQPGQEPDVEVVLDERIE